LRRSRILIKLRGVAPILTAAVMANVMKILRAVFVIQGGMVQTVTSCTVLVTTRLKAQMIAVDMGCA